MADEPTNVQEQPQEQPAPAETTPQHDEAAVLRQKLEQYEKMVLSPEYAEFLASKAAPTRGQERQAPSREDREEMMERLNNMSRAEFASFVRDVTLGEVREKLFAPLAQSVVNQQVKEQITAATAKYPDFWNYRDQMIQLSQSNPNLSAEQAYLLARNIAGASGSPPATRPKPTEVPGQRPAAGPKPKEKLGFADAFEEAFKKSGMKE